MDKKIVSEPASEVMELTCPNVFLEALNEYLSAINAEQYDNAISIMSPFHNAESELIKSNAQYYTALGYLKSDRTDEAITLFELAILNNCSNVQLYEIYGSFLLKRLEVRKAEQVISLGMDRCKASPDLLAHYSGVRVVQGRLTEAENILKDAMLLDENNVSVLINLGSLYEQMGRVKEAISITKKVIALDQCNPTAIANLLLLLNYQALPKTTIFKAHTLHMAPIKSFELGKRLNQEKRKIRVGYFSGDFRMHAVAHFFLAIIENYSRENFELYCYSDSPIEDSVTRIISSNTDQWRSTYQYSDHRLASKIIEDEIDILVNLSGHAGGKRQSIFKSKPAPIQVLYLGYPNTFGIPEIDYRIVDSITDPEGEENFSSERLIRLTPPFVCFTPIVMYPEVNSLPALEKGYVTFGSFNRLSKLSDHTVALWSQVLKAMPTSRLMLKTKALMDNAVRQETLKRFEANGIDSERLIVLGWSATPSEHLESYHEVDLALDSFPYNGTTTTCDALYMGVPSVTIRGDRHVSRVSSTILESVGLGDFVAECSEDFVRTAIRLASDLGSLASLRNSLREAVVNSALTDGPKLVQQMEDFFMSLSGDSDKCQ
jgi:protein O-GlcNAc transferase